jgi:hypothetical protein
VAALCCVLLNHSASQPVLLQAALFSIFLIPGLKLKLSKKQGHFNFIFKSKASQPITKNQ